MTLYTYFIIIMILLLLLLYLCYSSPYEFKFRCIIIANWHLEQIWATVTDQWTIYSVQYLKPFEYVTHKNCLHVAFGTYGYNFTTLQPLSHCPNDHVSKILRTKKYWLSFVYVSDCFCDFRKRRSFWRFLSPAFFHQSQDTRMHALRLLLRKSRSVERGIGVLDFLQNH